jgi:hypothetical protein
VSKNAHRSGRYILIFIATVMIGACGQREPSQIIGKQKTAETNLNAGVQDHGGKKIDYRIQLFGAFEYSTTVDWTVDIDSPVGRRTKELFALLSDQKARTPSAVDTKKYKIAADGGIWQMEKTDGKSEVTNYISLYMFAPSYTVKMRDRTFKLDDADMKAVNDYIRFVYGAYEKEKGTEKKK